jgi:hypothetical protein
MGHSDHIGIKRGGTGDRINNGALDNGAGVATLIEVARAFTTSAQRPRRSSCSWPIPVRRTAGADLRPLSHRADRARDLGHRPRHADAALRLHRRRGVRRGPFDDGERAPEGERRDGREALARPMPEQAIFVRSDHYAMVKVGCRR